MQPTEAVAPLYIRKSATINVVGALISGVVTLVFGGLIVRAAYLGRFGQIPGMTWLWFFAALGMTVWTCRDAFDRAVVVTLDAEGFRDRRSGNVLTPWRVVRRAMRSDGRGAEGSAGIAFEIGAGDAPEVGDGSLFGSGRRTSTLSDHHSIRIDTGRLEISNDAIFDFVRRAAPHVEIIDPVWRWPST